MEKLTTKNIIIEKKNVKNFNLKVTPELDVFLSAPIEAGEKQINQFLNSKKDWIEKQLNYFKKHINSTKEKEYVSGESFLYLGKQYRLKVIESELENCKFEKGYIWLFVKDKDNKKKKKELLEKWFRQKSKAKLNEILIEQLNLFNEKTDIKLELRVMSTMWGSCNKAKRKIILNTKLIHQKRSFVNYVIAHEVAHLKYSNHSRDFYAWLTSHMPNWKQVNKQQ